MISIRKYDRGFFVWIISQNKYIYRIVYKCTFLSYRCRYLEATIIHFFFFHFSFPRSLIFWINLKLCINLSIDTQLNCDVKIKCFRFRFMSGKSGRIYLHTDIRMIICRKSDVDTASDFGSEPPKELRSYIHGPTNPKFSPRCWATWLFPWGCCQSLRSPSPLCAEV